MGILLEADYKGVLTGRESIWSGLSRAFSASKKGSQNPLERGEGEELRPQEHDGQLTYELMNRDSGVSAAFEFHRIEYKVTKNSYLCSRRPRARSFLLRSAHLRLYLSCSGRAHVTRTVYQYQA